MSGDGPVVVVRGRGAEAASVADAVADAGGVVADADPDADAEADAVFAVGESSLFSFTDDAPSAPILPVACGVGRESVPHADVPRAIRALRAGATRTVEHPRLVASVAGESVGTALADVTLMTDEPARISEYAVATPDERVGSFRADGVVVAAPLGSTGYARAAGGPILAPGTGVVAVPIAPYTTLSDSWVRRLPVTLSVERDEASVTLILDDREVTTVPPHAPVELAAEGTRPFLRLTDRPDDTA